MILLFLLLFYPRILPFKCGQNQVSNRLIVAFVVVVAVAIVVVVIIIVVVVHVAVVVIYQTNLPLKFG